MVFCMVLIPHCRVLLFWLSKNHASLWRFQSRRCLVFIRRSHCVSVIVHSCLSAWWQKNAKYECARTHHDRISMAPKIAFLHYCNSIEGNRSVSFPLFIVRTTITPSVVLMLHTGLCMTQRLPWILGWISFDHRCCGFHHVWREQWEWCLIKLVLANNLSAAVGPFQGHVLRRRPWTSSVPAAFYVVY